MPSAFVRAFAVSAAAILTLSACSGKAVHRASAASSVAPATAAGTPTSTPVATPPKLAGSHPCANPSFTCSTLAVPLDRTGKVPGTLKLQVEVANNVHAPKGVLLFISGGPGSYGANYSEGLAQRFPAVTKQYRWASLDVRGTGQSGARDCPALQRQVGSDDLTIPTLAAINQCRTLLGATATLYSTTNTLADLEDLRRAVGITTWSLDGISYGTYVAERYALAHPHNVSKMVLDSIVPHTGDDPLNTVPFAAFIRVFRSICAERSCPSDPVADLRTILRGRTDAATVSDAILEAGIYDGYYAGVPEALDQAAHGKPAAFNALLAQRAKDAATTPVTQLSQATHASALCADIKWPWSASDSPARRAAILNALAARQPVRTFGPYSAADAASNGFALTCENWPSTPAPVVAKYLPPVPTLLLGGSHDLSCPIEWLQQEAAVTPNKVVAIFSNTGHSQQTYNGSPKAVTVMTNFLDS
jgi:pimeloyl-ACP methyl ester carboxylesterase